MVQVNWGKNTDFGGGGLSSDPSVSEDDVNFTSDLGKDLVGN